MGEGLTTDEVLREMAERPDTWQQSIMGNRVGKKHHTSNQNLRDLARQLLQAREALRFYERGEGGKEPARACLPEHQS